MPKTTIRTAALISAIIAVLALAGCAWEPYSTSGNAYLSALVPSVGTVLVPSFDPATSAYTATVANAAGGVSFTPSAMDSGATITINGCSVPTNSESGSQPLSIGTTTIAVVVTASDGRTKRTYTVTVRADSLVDDFSRSDTSGRNLGSDWTVTGQGADAMRISSETVSSVYQETGNPDGVYASYRGGVDYSEGLAASTLIYLSAAPSGAPSVIGGIRINADAVTGAGYLCEMENSGSAYQLKLALFTGTRELWSKEIAVAEFSVGTWYKLSIDSLGSTLKACLKSSDGSMTYATLGYTETERTYSTGGVAFYNYVTNASLAPLGYPLYFDDFTIERYAGE